MGQGSAWAIGNSILPIKNGASVIACPKVSAGADSLSFFTPSRLFAVLTRVISALSDLLKIYVLVCQT